MLFCPEILNYIAFAPYTALYDPIVLDVKVYSPTATLRMPDVMAGSELRPINVLPADVVSGINGTIIGRGSASLTNDRTDICILIAIKPD